MQQHTEIERTYSPGLHAEVPDLRDLDGVARVGEPSTIMLRATYHDTEDLALVRAGVTLRRRTGGDDEGWHLKLPVGTGRSELRLPLTEGSTPPPVPLVETVRSWTRGAPLGVVATIETRRTERSLYAGDGTVLAVLADDEVTGLPGGARAPVCWREWELELVEATPQLLADADDLMAAVGVRPSELDRKILHVLGDRVPPASPLPRVGPGRPAGALLHRRLAELVGDLHRRDSDLRGGDFAEGVHQVRIVCRRLRSALAAYRPLVDRTVTDPVRDELRWLGQELSVARDDRVIGEEILAMVAEQPDELVRGPVGTRVHDEYGRLGQREDEHVRRVLSGPRYYALVERLDRLAADPPLTDRAAEPTKDVLPGRLRKEWKRLSSRVAAIEPGPRHDVTLHDVRKAAKRLRYALEPAEPAWPHDAKKLRTAVKRLTTVLGERQDTVVARQHLLRLAAAAEAAGESAFTYGRLHGEAAARAERLDAAFDAEWARASRKKLRGWLT